MYTHWDLGKTLLGVLQRPGKSPAVKSDTEPIAMTAKGLHDPIVNQYGASPKNDRIRASSTASYSMLSPCCDCAFNGSHTLPLSPAFCAATHPLQMRGRISCTAHALPRVTRRHTGPTAPVRWASVEESSQRPTRTARGTAPPLRSPRAPCRSWSGVSGRARRLHWCAGRPCKRSLPG